MASTHEIITGDCRDTLATLKDRSVHCCVTSPPYWGLRDYQTGSTKEIGSEPTLDDHLANLADVFREVRRVLRDDGTLWLNYGDSYSGSWGNYGKREGSQRELAQHRLSRKGYDQHTSRPPASMANDKFKPKDLMSLPHRVAFALQDDGWYLRSVILWLKKSPMPESVRGSRWERCKVKVAEGVYNGRRDQYRDDCEFATNLHHESKTEWNPCPGCDKCRDNDGLIYRQAAGRPTTAHEYVFLLTKSPSYFYAQDENRAPSLPPPMSSINANGWQQDAPKEVSGRGMKTTHREYNPAGRNQWTYWSDAGYRMEDTTWWNDLSSSSFSGQHFATMPLSLASRCIRLGTSSVGVCSACGAPYAPVIDTDRIATRPGNTTKVGRASQHEDSPHSNHSGSIVGNRDPQRHTTETNIVGYRATCRCNVSDKAPAVILDPFGGAGTTAIAARELGHSSIMCELNTDYADLAKARERKHFCGLKEKKKLDSADGQSLMF